ncbi:hypothetical protein [Thaumasiovibrio subtropicus]|uniref:hypothetical protein n=1 Tax=Thaumasiovibrio subtropicus TaxID=1891207 RepID=UPI00131AECA5|nr:hypothetical protein [Thaumasiovibrio subtropicus]
MVTDKTPLSAAFFVSVDLSPSSFYRTTLTPLRKGALSKHSPIPDVSIHHVSIHNASKPIGTEWL